MWTNHSECAQNISQTMRIGYIILPKAHDLLFNNGNDIYQENYSNSLITSARLAPKFSQIPAESRGQDFHRKTSLYCSCCVLIPKADGTLNELLTIIPTRAFLKTHSVWDSFKHTQAAIFSITSAFVEIWWNWARKHNGSRGSINSLSYTTPLYTLQTDK